MRTRDKVSLALSPLLLRIMLGGVFIWAGLGKLIVTDKVDGPTAAVLANMGVLKPGSTQPADSGAPKTPLPSPEKPADTPVKPPSSEPDSPVPPPVPPPGKQPAADPADAKPGDAAPKGDAPAETKPSGSARHPGDATGAPTLGGMMVMASLAAQPASAPAASAPASTPAYAASDFPDGASTRRVNMVAIGIHHAAFPAPSADGKPVKPTWPKQLAGGRTPVYLAWAVALGELAAGAAVLAGLLTRLGALGIAWIMLGAMWLTQFGPAIASGNARLGFLPAYDTFGPDWMPLLIQFTLFMSALALFFAGPGLLAIDNALFARPKRSDDHDGE